MVIAGMAHKHSHRYAEYALFAMFFVVPPIVLYFWKSFRQALSGGIVLVKAAGGTVRQQRDGKAEVKTVKGLFHEFS